MTLVSPDVRAKARAAQKTLETVSKYAGTFAAACSWSATAHPGLASLAGASGFLSVTARVAAERQRDIAQDPPRDDYSSQTYLSRRRVRPELVLEGLEPLGTDSPRVLVALGASLSDGAAAEVAMLRAFERAAGAFQAGNPSAAEARLTEQRRFAARSSEALARASGTAAIAAADLETEQLGMSAPQSSRSGTLEQLLSDQILASLYRAGVTIGELRSQSVISTPDPRRQLVIALRSCAPALADIATSIGEWDAESDARKVERRTGRSSIIIEETEHGFTWRFVGPGERLIARSEARFPSREEARANAMELLEGARDATIRDE